MQPEKNVTVKCLLFNFTDLNFMLRDVKITALVKIIACSYLNVLHVFLDLLHVD